MHLTHIVWRGQWSRILQFRIRVEPELKERLEREASEQRLTLAAYVQQILSAERPPNWDLANPELSHNARTGTIIKLNVAYDWPAAILVPEHAAKLGAELLRCASAAMSIKKPEFKAYQSKNDPSLIAIVRSGRNPPRVFEAAATMWTILDPPSGVAPDIALDIEQSGICYFRSNNPYRPGDFIGGGIRGKR